MEPQTTALITDPMAAFGFLAAVVALVFWASELPRCKKLFEVVPIYVYFLPMLATTAGITPSASPLYDWTVPYLLLFVVRRAAGRRGSSGSRCRCGKPGGRARKPDRNQGWGTTIGYTRPRS